MKYAFYCPACKSAWQSDSDSEITIENCHTCGKHPLYTGYTADEWKALDKTSKDAICTSLESRTQSNMEFKAPTKSDTSTWMRMIRFQGWLVFFAIIIAAIVAASLMMEEQPLLSLLIILVAIVVGLFLVAFSMMFVDMAADLRAIRNSTEDKRK